MAYLVDGNITKNFKVSELCNKLAKEDVKLVLSPEMIEHAEMMQELRDWYGKPLNVSSWYRTRRFNAFVGGDHRSAHLDGLATDINNIPEGLYGAFESAWRAICVVHCKVGGVNLYDWGMHFCSNEDRFGHREFQVRDMRGKK